MADFLESLFETPWQRLGWATIGLLLLLKVVAVLRLSGFEHQKSWLARIVYFLIWPGVDPRPFMFGRVQTTEAGKGFGQGLALFLGGLIGCIALSILYPVLPEQVVGWAGIACLLIAVHLGIGTMLPIAIRAFGWNVPNLFDRPWASRSVSEFWSCRWNLAFVEMNRLLFAPALARILGRKSSVFALFILSGLLHELAISFPAGSGWGLPLIYFFIQSLAVWIEHRTRIRSRIMTWAVVLLPMPLLFHQPFRHQVVEPAFLLFGQWIEATSSAEWLAIGIWTLGILQLLVLAASLQVPTRLKWKEELPRLSPLNEKLFWTYGIFIAFTILGLGVLVFALHDELARGDRAAGALALFACTFWILRLIVDKTMIRVEHWPKGPAFIIGHSLLTSLFVALIAGYGGLAIRAFCW